MSDEQQSLTRADNSVYTQLEEDHQVYTDEQQLASVDNTDTENQDHMAPQTDHQTYNRTSSCPSLTLAILYFPLL